MFFFILIVGSIYDKIIYIGERFLKPKNMTFKVSKSELIPVVKTLHYKPELVN